MMSQCPMMNFVVFFHEFEWKYDKFYFDLTFFLEKIEKSRLWLLEVRSTTRSLVLSQASHIYTTNKQINN